MQLEILGNVYLDDVLVLGGNITVTEMLHPVYGVPMNMLTTKRTTDIDVKHFIYKYLVDAKEDSIIKFKGGCFLIDDGLCFHEITPYECFHDDVGYVVDLSVNEMTYKEFIDKLVEIGYVA